MEAVARSFPYASVTFHYVSVRGSLEPVADLLMTAVDVQASLGQREQAKVCVGCVTGGDKFVLRNVAPQGSV